jgi:sodium/proline symporter
VATERLQCSTISSFFEKRFNDGSGRLRFVSAIFSLVFFTMYASAILVSLGRLCEDIFAISYLTGITFSTLVVFLTLLGGFLSVVWIDFFQGIFLLAMIILVPLVALPQIGGIGGVFSAANLRGVSLSVLPSFTFSSIKDVFFLAAGWGLGYFGQPHVLNKFMGISDVKDIRKAQYVGLSWQMFSMAAAISIGLIGLAFFKDGIGNSEFIFVYMVKALFFPFLAGIVLCAILAAAINVIGSLILAASSIVVEDFFKRNKSKQILPKAWIVCVASICLVAYILSFNNSKTVYSLVLNAWSGLGCTFGPLLLVSLYSKMSSRIAALSGVVVGGLVAGLWPYVNASVPPMIVGFTASLAAILIVAMFDKKHTVE